MSTIPVVCAIAIDSATIVHSCVAPRAGRLPRNAMPYIVVFALVAVASGVSALVFGHRGHLGPLHITANATAAFLWVPIYPIIYARTRGRPGIEPVASPLGPRSA